jgi:hypothetical protein
MALGLSGCAASTAVHDFCLIYEPIYGSGQDTPPTLQQIDEMNGKFECLCREDCPSSGP